MRAHSEPSATIQAMHMHLKCAKYKRGSTLLTTVLVSVVAATIAMVAIQVSLVAGASELDRLEVSQAKLSMNTGLTRVAATLEHNPLSIYYQVLQDESDRLCYLAADNTVVVQAGSPWPAECGPVWGYTRSEYTSGVLISPPSPSNSNIEVSAFGRSGNVVVGQIDSYSVLGPQTPSMYSGSLLDTTTQAFTQVSYNGIVYSYKEIVVADYQSFSQNSILASERSVSSTLSATCSTVCFHATPTPESGSSLSIRNVYKNPLSPASIDSNITSLQTVACLDTSPIVINNRVSSLCLANGSNLVTIQESVTPMQGVASVLVTPGSVADTLNVYSSTQTPSNSGSLDSWVLVGVFNYPASGVLYSDYDTYVGICPPTESGCSVSFTSGITIVAGSPSGRKDIIINSAVTSSNNLGLVASGSVVIGSSVSLHNTVINASLVAAGETNGALVQTQTSSPSAGNASLTINGQIVLARYDISLANYSAKTLNTKVGNAPMLPSPVVQYRRLYATPLTATQASALAEESRP